MIQVTNFLKNNSGLDTFMAMTVCPSYSSAFKAEVLARYGTDKRTYKKNWSTPADPTVT